MLRYFLTLSSRVSTRSTTMKKVYQCLIVISALITSTRAEVELKVFNGYPIEITDAPFMAKVEVNLTYGTSYCGGSIITEDFILTAAHCEFNFLIYSFSRIC